MKTNNLHNNKGGFKVPKDYFDNLEKKFFDKISDKDDHTASLLDEIPSGLKAPDDYFNNLQDHLIKKLNSSTDDSSTIPDNLETGLTVPENYFKDIEENVFQKTIHTDQKTKVISLFSRKNLLYASSIAAMIAIIISISTNREKETFNFDSNFDAIDVVDIQEYFDEGNAEFSDTEIASLLDNETSLIDTFDENNDISDEELENYLSDEELEDEIIYIE